MLVDHVGLQVVASIEAAIQWLPAAMIAVVLSCAGIAKLRKLGDFQSTLSRFTSIPAALVKPLAVTIPAAECAIAGAFWVGNGAPASIAATALFLTFASVTTLELLNSKDAKHCGCLGRHMNLQWTTPILNIGLATVAAASLFEDLREWLLTASLVTLLIALLASIWTSRIPSRALS